MKKWAWIAFGAFIVFGIASGNRDEPNPLSFMAAIVFLVSIFVILGKWIASIIKRHLEWVADDDDEIVQATEKTVTKPKKTQAKHANKPTKTKPAFAEYGKTSEISPFVAMGKSSGESIRFDIKPDREIEIEYQDASGEITRRCITAQIIETAWGGLVIKAFCHLRGGQRSFKLENIHRLYENGHEINIVDWLEQIGFSQNRRVKKRIAKEKLSAMVDKMSNTALDEFIKNSN